MSAELDLYLLGATRVGLDKAAIEVKPRKALALLIHLAVTAGRHSRDSLATMLWPNSDQRRARHALRSRLSELNLILGKGWIEADRESVGLRAGFWLDVNEFERILASETADPQSLMAAAELYRGDFLTGFTLPDCPEFDEWQFFQTESLRQVLASALERLIGILSEQNEHETAVPYARRWLALDPLHEPAHRQLMLLYARAGQQAAALRQYDLCRQTLKDELGVSPAPETTALYEDIQAKKVVERKSTPRPRHNLPTQTTTFIGREAELAEIEHLLLEESGCRLLNLVGPGGIGKTRLALATAGQIVDAFPDGVFFVSLASVGEAADIVRAIAEALRLTFFGTVDPQEQLLDYLGQKQLLLVIDNFEHLLDGAGLLSEILARAPRVTLLATSRERLNLREEWVYEVRGLPFPTGDDQTSEVSETSEVVTSYSAVELFLQRARQAEAGFAPSAADTGEIGHICRLVEGMPLGLELAAPWIKVLSCQEIAAEIKRSLDFLTSPLQNVPERHRSLRVVFEQTWQRLSPAEQVVLQQLSVFRGGCTREAAEAVSGATFSLLSSLVDKALLRRTNLGRFELHELIRQFAEAQLQTDPNAVEQAQQRHRDYFVAFLEARTAGIKGHKQKETMAEIKADMDNVRLVWRRIVAGREAGSIERAAECLHVYYTYSSGHYEGQVAFQQAVATLTIIPDSPADDGQPIDLIVLDQQENLVGFLLAVQAYFLARISGSQVKSEKVIAQLLQAKPGDKRKEAIALAFLSHAIHYQGRISDSRPYAELALALSSETGELMGESWSLMGLGSPGVHGRPAEAEQLLKRALSVCEKSGDPSSRGFSCQNLAWVSIDLGKYFEAAQYVDQATTTFGEIGNVQGLGYSSFRAGQLAIALGDYAGAIQNIRQALAYYDETRSALHANYSRVWLGIALRLQGDYRQAEETSQQTLAAFKSMNDLTHVGYCLLNLGCLAHTQGDLSQAEHLQREALTSWQQAGQEARVADASRCLGHLMVARGQHRFDEVRQYFRQGLELAIKHQMAPIALDICVGVAQLAAQAGEVERALRLLTLAERHEASTFETKEKARRHIAELVNHLPPEALRAAQAKGRSWKLWTAAQVLLAELMVDAT